MRTNSSGIVPTTRNVIALWVRSELFCWHRLYARMNRGGIVALRETLLRGSLDTITLPH